MRPFIAVMLFVVACADTSSRHQGCQSLPKNAKVDQRVQLSTDDCEQIVRLIAQQTTQPIDFIEPSARDGEVEVTCGYWEKPGVPNPKGNAYTLKKTAGGWIIIRKGGWVF